MVKGGLGKNAREPRRGRRICPSGGREITGRRCNAHYFFTCDFFVRKAATFCAASRRSRSSSGKLALAVLESAPPGGALCAKARRAVELR